MVRPPIGPDVIREAALRRARDEAETIDRMAEGARLQSYRAFLQTTVRFASPILLRAIDGEGVPFAEFADGLRPPRGWPRRGRSPHAFRYAAAQSVAGLLDTWAIAPSELTNSRADIRVGGVRLKMRRLGVVGVRVVGSAIEVQMVLGSCRLRSSQGVGRLTTDRLVPETLATGCIGQRLDGLVDHPLFLGAGWTIDRIDSPTGVDWSVIVFATGQEPVTLPWGRGIGRIHDAD